MVRQGATADTVRAAILTATAAQQRAQVPNGVAARALTDESDVRRAAMIEGLTARALNRAPEGQFAEPARAYRSARIVDVLQELMGTRSFDSPDQIIQRFAQRSAQHATSDFPLIMGAVAQNVVAFAYERAAPTYRTWSAPRDFNNFMPHGFLRLSDLPRLKKLGENAEIKSGSFAESKETAQLDTFALQLRFSRRMMINDQLGMFVQALSTWGQMVALQENELAYAALKTAKLADNKLVFHADHNNLAGAGAAITEASLDAMRKSLRARTSLAGPDEKARKLNLTPAILVVGPNQELAAQKLLTAITAANATDVNPFQSSMELVVDAEIDGNEWYGFASPTMAPTFVHGFLSGSSGPVVTEDEPFGIDGYAAQCIHDFGLGAIDSVGGWKNPGQ
jgi:hypothetical protein